MNNKGAAIPSHSPWPPGLHQEDISFGGPLLHQGEPPLSRLNPALPLFRTERLQGLIRELRSPLTILINVMELQKVADHYGKSNTFLERIQRASEEIRERLEALSDLIEPPCDSTSETIQPLALWIEEEGTNGAFLRILQRELKDLVALERAKGFEEGRSRLLSRPYDLVLCGYSFPQGTGLELMESVRSTGRFLPFIILTQRGNERIAAQCLDAGCTGYFSLSMLRERGRLRNKVKKVLEETQRFRKWEVSFQEVQHLAMLDGLTSVYNRSFIEQLLEMEVRRATRYRLPLCVALIDLDGFKEVNDRYGHRQGDEVLRRLARSLKSFIRATDYIGRYGGDEFLVVLPQVDLLNGMRLCRRMMRQITRQGRAEDFVLPFQLSLSVGLTWLDPAGHMATPSQLIEAADRALYEAKRKGKNRLCFLPSGTHPA